MACKAALSDRYCSIVWQIFWKTIRFSSPLGIRDDSLHIEWSPLKQFNMLFFVFNVADKKSSSLISCNCLAAASSIVHLQLIARDIFCLNLMYIFLLELPTILGYWDDC